VAEIVRVVPTRATERQRSAEEVTALASEVRPRDPAMAVVLERLADAVKLGRSEEARAYAAAIDPRATADTITIRRSPIWGLLEVARNVLVFAPIAVTWYGLSTATDAYANLLAIHPEFGDRPFLLLWEQGFQGVGHSIIFSILAAIDASLIAVLIVLSLAIHVRADVRDAGSRAASLLKESHIRATVAHATSVAASGIGSDEADELLDQMAAEERRVFERAIEREQQLYDLEGAIGELRKSAADLAKAAEALTAKAQEDVRSRP
jgi:hypothetical protein